MSLITIIFIIAAIAEFSYAYRDYQAKEYSRSMRAAAIACAISVIGLIYIGLVK